MPVFVIGAPKCGSTSLHVALSKTGLFDYPKIKDTHYLKNPKFNISEYSKFFECNGKRIFEVDQNLAIHPEAFSNIFSNFTGASIVYIIREQEDRFFSAYKFLIKMGLRFKTFDDAVKNEYNWMISHGLYSRNIRNFFSNEFVGDNRLIIVKFECLVASDGITYRALMKLLNVDVGSTDVLPKRNESLSARSPALVRGLSLLLNVLNPYLPASVIGVAKTSKLIQKLLFYRSNKIVVDRSVFGLYAALFRDSGTLVDRLNFRNGIALVSRDECK